MEQTLFSILIANYNNGKYIMEAINSVYNQTYTNWEIIIVDDCSTDNSFEIYNQLKNEKIRIFYNEKNEGCGYTKRRCAEEATGDICGFLDPDDALTPEAISEMIEAHSDNTDVSLIYSTYYICDESLNVQGVKGDVNQVKNGDPLFFNMEYKIGHFSSFKRSYYKKTMGIDPSLKRAVDQDLYLKLYDAGKALLINKPFYYYRIHESGISTNMNVNKAYFWHWVVNIGIARKRNVNIENLFVQYVVRKDEYNTLQNQYLRLKKYEKLNNFLGMLRRKFR